MADYWSELAEYVAEFFSRDACQWPNLRTANRPLRVLFIFEDPAASFVEPLCQAFEVLLSSEFTTENGKSLVLSDRVKNRMQRFVSASNDTTKRMTWVWHMS